MDNKKYYEHLSRVPGADGNVNAIWAVVNKIIPFKDMGDAVKYAIQAYGDDYKPGSDIVTIDPDKCKELAMSLCPEVHRLKDVVHDLIEKNNSELHRTAEQRDNLNVISLKEQIEKELLQKKVNELIGVSDGLHKIWQILHQRDMELWECSRYAGKG